METTYKSQKLTRVGDNLYRNGEGVYYARLFKNGKQHKRCLKTHDRKTADGKLLDFEKEVERGLAEAPDLQFEELGKKWLESIKLHLKQSTYYLREKKIKQVEPFFRGKKLRNLGRDDVQAWINARSPKVGARTFNMERETLKIMFRFAKEELRALTNNPLEFVKKRREIKAVIVPPTREQFAQLLECFEVLGAKGREARTLIQFLAYSGCRIEEARQVRWRDVDFTKSTLRVTGGEAGTKNYKQRLIPLFPSLRALLERLKPTEVVPSNPIFTHKSSKTALISASKLIGLPKGEHYTHHDMRHFFCSNAIEKNIPDHVVAAWLGHSDGGILVKTTYGHLRKGFGDEMAKLMDFSG